MKPTSERQLSGNAGARGPLAIEDRPNKRTADLLPDGPAAIK
jgi:hypothetical protein